MSIDLAERSADLLANCLYANIATSRDDVPWNTPVTAIPDSALTFYWSSWKEAVHSHNIAANPRAFLTFYDSTRIRGTNNLRGIYLQCEAGEVTDIDEAEKAFRLLYPDDTVDLTSFLGDGIKRFYRATPRRAWLNSLSEKELAPDTLKMRTEVSLEDVKAALT
ncbi:pyridoxamine 5'-phosphate oxidase family protein [Salinicola halophyticus]|uniref:pyridoxamine 5'-phosphate oxidase family protein n=1 Tax=Salinicola halophyticus TaxID=1808881 RepID=UPI001300AE9E|nr:pyridoxamine 5'-phosphate oxidase family protein [Salinicola halophyticus]